jgi:4-amino-4-deoxy-L-arabinose transferase-like glycosyltransferase
MPGLTERAPAPLLARRAAWVLCAIWLLAGVVGHDPWKVDDALNLGVAWEMTSGSWLVPRIAGDPWLVTPPLYHWVAALCGKIFGVVLPWHDAARLASAFFGGLYLVVISRTAYRLNGGSAALAAPLLAIGTLGMLVPLHDAQPAVAAIAGFAITLRGLAIWRQHATRGGAIFGTGLALSFLAAGVDIAAVELATALTLMLHSGWRQRDSVKAWLSALAITLALALPWPLLLWQQTPTLFDLWWSAEQASLGFRGGLGLNHLEMLAWAAWPVLPLALWALWLERRNSLRPQNLLMMAATVWALLLFVADSPKPASLLPALVPLTLLAASAAARLRRGAANAFDWFGMMTFSLVAGLIWLGGIAMFTGEPARVAKNFSKPAPGFVAEVHPVAILLAIAATVAWIAVILRTPRSPWRAAARWSVGLTTIWVLLTLLWLPWIDYGKTYRYASADLRHALGANPGCIARRGLGLAQRASLDYFNGIRTVGVGRAGSCRYMIVQTAPGAEKDVSGWKLIKETSRHGDKGERLRLYRRAE